MTSFNVVNDVLTSTPLGQHMTLKQRRQEQYFKNVPCFCKSDVYAIAHPMFTKAFEMRYPALKVMYSPYAQPLPWQHTLYVSLNFIRTIFSFDCIAC